MNLVHQTTWFERRKILSRILSTPNPKLGNPLAQHKTELVWKFYESDEVSRMMPGRKDYVSVKQGDQHTHVQKRLVLNNLKEAYQLFKEQKKLDFRSLLNFDLKIVY